MTTCPICNREHDDVWWCIECHTSFLKEPQSTAFEVAEWGAKRAREAMAAEQARAQKERG